MPHVRLDIDIHYRIEGSGPAVLLLHGLGSSGDDWEQQIAVLARTHTVIVPDMRGHGKSAKPEGTYGIPLFARDVTQLVKRLRVGSVHVVGISMGGMIAFQMVLDEPELVRSLVIVNSGPELIPRTAKEHALIFLRLALLRLFGMKTMAGLLAKKLFPKPGQHALRTLCVERLTKNDPAAYERSLRGLLGWTVKPRLDEVRCPTLVVAGDRDYTSVAFKQEYMSHLAGAELVVIPDSGHFTPLDQPELLNRTLIRFLEGQEIGDREVTSLSRNGVAQ